MFKIFRTITTSCVESKVKLPFYRFSKINVFVMDIWDLAKEQGISTQLLIIISYFCRICKVSRPALSITVHRHFFLYERWVCSHRSAFYWKMHFPWMGPCRKDLPELWQHYRYEKPTRFFRWKVKLLEPRATGKDEWYQGTIWAGLETFKSQLWQLLGNLGLLPKP